MAACWALFTFVRDVLGSGRLVSPNKWVQGPSSLDPYIHTDILMIKPWSLWYLVALCLHAVYGAQAFLLSLDPEGLGSLPLKSFSALARPCVASSSIIPESKKVYTSPRSCPPTPSLPKTRQDGSRIRKGFHPLTCLVLVVLSQPQDASVLHSAVNSTKLAEARKPKGCVHPIKI